MVTVVIGKLNTAPRQAHCIFRLFNADDADRHHQRSIAPASIFGRSS
jgi:hypothetical protein